MRVNTNVNSLVAYRNLSTANSAVSDSMAKLSTGFRINKAADDAAGLGIANKLRADNRALQQASRNAEQANSVLQIAEGSTSTIQKMLERMKELATQAGSDNVDADGRTRINDEFQVLKDEITRTVDTTMFQGNKLLAGEFGISVDTSTGKSDALGKGTGLYEAKLNGAKEGSYTFSQAADGKLTITDGAGATETVTVAAGKQEVSFGKFGITLKLDANFDEKAASGTLKTKKLDVKAGSGGGSFLVGSSGDYKGQDTISLDNLDLTLTKLGINAEKLDSLDNARNALDKIDSAMTEVNKALGKIGASQNRIQYTQDNLKTTIVNFSAAESVIRDLDMADEMTKFSKNNIISQAATAMLAQANQSTQGVLQLLRG
jgi:flagellin